LGVIKIVDSDFGLAVNGVFVILWRAFYRFRPATHIHTSLERLNPVMEFNLLRASCGSGCENKRRVPPVPLDKNCLFCLLKV